MEKGRAGEVYNVCSGNACSVESFLNCMIQIGVFSVRIQINPEKIRAIDVPRFLGNNQKIRQDTGWQPEVSVDQTIADMFEFCASHIHKN